VNRIRAFRRLAHSASIASPILASNRPTIYDFFGVGAPDDVGDDVVV